MTAAHRSACLLASLIWLAVIGNGNGDTGFYFSYSHQGEDWMEGECASRDRQSPIDFNEADAPWSCSPPVFKYLKQFLGPVYFKKMGFAKLAGEDEPEAPPTPEEPELDIGAAPAPSIAVAPAAASLLELDSSVEQPYASAPAAAPAPPPLVVPGCNGPLGAFFFSYDMAEKPMMIQNNGHTLSTDLKGHGLGSIFWDGFSFNVLSVNFHVHSEHTFKGKQYPLELHIVHREPETNHILVVAIPFDVPPGAAASLLQRKRRKGCHGALRGRPNLPNEPCAPLDPVDMDAVVDGHEELVDHADLTPEQAAEIASVHVSGPKKPQPSDAGYCSALTNLLSESLPREGETKTVPLRKGPVDLLGPLIGGPADCSVKEDPKEVFVPQGFFQYSGSLTAPPCTEAVTWLVRKDPLYASRSQVEQLRVATLQANSNFDNARSVMPVMNRLISYRLAVQGNPPPPPTVPHDPNTSPKEREVDFAGVAAAKEAVFRALEAKSAKNMIADGVAKAQEMFAGAGAGIDPSLAASMQNLHAGGDVMITTPLPTPDPERVLSRIVDSVAEQMDGAERAAALAAAGVGDPHRII
jgi:hypothetical protein